MQLEGCPRATSGPPESRPPAWMEVTVLGCIKGTALSFKTLMNTAGYTSVVQRDVLVFFVTYNFEMEILVHMCLHTCSVVLGSPGIARSQVCT